MIDDFDMGYRAGYKKAYEEMQKFIYSKDINQIDQMHERYYAENKMQGAVGITGPIGYMP